jgi:hypothetical protein
MRPGATADLFALRPGPRTAAEVVAEHQRAVDLAREQSIQRRFEDFHRDQPQVYAELVKLARRARGRGAARVGIRMAWEVMRWNLTIETAPGDFKLNDHFTSRYARLIMRQEPDLADVFETRELRAE